jgi:predicted metal-binding membrane protein
MSVALAVETLLKRERLVVLAGVVVVAALAWLYLIELATAMGGMADMMALKSWTLTDGALMFVMWAVMMLAMMLPSAAPMILLYALVWRKQRIEGSAYAPTGAFAAGYVAVWAAFSLLATALQWGLEQVALLSPAMVATSSLLGGAILIVAGVYQWTPYKHACLSRCRSPIYFLSRHWRSSTGGAFVMGVEHGAYCLGCCWVLMALLFVGGVMNLLWIAAIAFFVLIEKLLPHGNLVGRAGGLAMIGAGIAIIFAI